MSVDISGLDKAHVLMALFNDASAQGRGYLRDHEKDMDLKEATVIIASGKLSFDYVRGRVLKVELSGNAFSSRLYDRDNGEGAAQRAIDKLKDVMAQ